MNDLNMTFVVVRDNSEFWITYGMNCVAHSSGSYEEPPESIYEFAEGSATATSTNDFITCPMDYDEIQDLAKDHAKKHEVQVG